MKFYKDLTKYQKAGNRALYLIIISLPVFVYAFGGGAGAIIGGILFLVVLFAILPNVFNNALVDSNIQKVEDILRKGTKVPGTIVSYRTDPEFDDYEHSVFEKTTGEAKGTETDNTIFTVEYEYNGEKHTFDAPPTVFSFEKIESNDVDVYILLDKVFVDNYKIDLEELEENIQEPKDFAKAFVGATVALIALGALCIMLGDVGVIPFDLATKLLAVIMVVYVLAMIIAHAKRKKN